MRAFLLFLFCVTIFYADNYKDALAYLNKIRHSSGLPALRVDYRLKRAAYAHARYLAASGEKGHEERRGSKEYSGMTPSSRIVKAGYSTRVVVENISFGERRYADSIDTLLSTVYHRLAFLDMRVDSIGIARAGRYRSVFVYDMSLSSIERLCGKAHSSVEGEYIYGVCADSSIKLPAGLFKKALRDIESKSAKIVCYPFEGARNIPLGFVHERPDPVANLKNAGYPITISFNPAYYGRVSMKSFRLYRDGKRVKGVKILSRANDPYAKLRENTFVLIPRNRLHKNSSYRVEFRANAGGKSLLKSWSFHTGER